MEEIRESFGTKVEGGREGLRLRDELDSLHKQPTEARLSRLDQGR